MKHPLLTVLLYTLVFTLGVNAAPPTGTSIVAGRVMTVDRKNNTFTIKPYSYEPIQNLVTIKVTTQTKYAYNVVLNGAKAANFSQVKSGSWVRATYDSNGVASLIIIHLKTPGSTTVPSPK